MGKITPLFGGEAVVPASSSDELPLDARVGDMTPHLVQAKNQVAESQKEEARLGKQAEIAARAAHAWEQRAMAAVRAGDDVVAREALLRKRQHDQEFERFRAAQKEQNRQTAARTRALMTLNFRMEETEHRRNVVAVRAELTAALPQLEAETSRVAEASLHAEASPHAGTSVDAEAVLKRLEAKMTDIEAELELSDEAMANLAREAGDALRTKEELARLRREASDPALLGAKPLAKTVPNDADSARLSPSQVAGVSGPQRTKR